MVHQRIRNLILLAMVFVCVYLSSKVWLQLPDFLMYNYEKKTSDISEEKPDINVWDVIRPLKNIIKYKDNYTVLYSDYEYGLWEKAVDIVESSLKDYLKGDVKISTTQVFFPTQYLKLDFSNDIPIEIFTEEMNIGSSDINNVVKSIRNITIDLDNKNCIYIYNGEDTIKFESKNTNNDKVANVIEGMDFSRFTEYKTDEKIGDNKINIPVPMETVALNPVFVRSELDVFDTEKIDGIAKNYFKNNYEYVRKVVELNGNRVYMYRTEKVLKISAEGQLDFSDANADYKGNHGVYGSLLTSLIFTKNFLGFPDDGYISKIESIQYEGNYGYRFTFSYTIKEKPILFSRVRENAALQIDVIDDKVVSYKRFIRKIDEGQTEKMQNYQVMSAVDVINKNLDTGDVNEAGNELRPLKPEMIKDISNIYLGYFDLSRISKEQLLRVVWVVETGNKSYIFNAISGTLIEEW